MKTAVLARSMLAAMLMLGAVGMHANAADTGADRKAKLKAIEGTVRLPMAATGPSGQTPDPQQGLAPAAQPIGVNEPGVNAPATKIDSGMPQRSSVKARLPRPSQGADFGQRTGAARSPAGNTAGPAPDVGGQQGEDED